MIDVVMTQTHWLGRNTSMRDTVHAARRERIIHWFISA